VYPVYCIVCGRNHLQSRVDEVRVYDKTGLALVTYHKDCTEGAKAMTVEGLVERNYIKDNVAERIIEGIARGFGPRGEEVKKTVKGGK